MKYRVKVIPRASRNEVTVLGPDELKVKLTAPPVEGKANALLIDVLADHFDIKKSAVHIARGAIGRYKIVKMDKER